MCRLVRSTFPQLTGLPHRLTLRGYLKRTETQSLSGKGSTTRRRYSGLWC